MKRTLIVSVLLLIVFPTAILSLMAGRNLRDREAGLRVRLQANADAALNAAAMHLRTRLESEIEQVRGMVQASGAGGRLSTQALAAQVRRFEHAHALAARVYVFRDPWGFLWPEEPTPAASGGHPSEEGMSDDRGEALKTALRREIASASSLLEPVLFAVDGTAYGFKRCALRADTYAGFAFDPAAFQTVLSQVLDALSGADFRLRVTGPGHDPAPALLVRDSLSAHTAATLQPAAGPAPLAARRLDPPFTHLTLSAYPADPAAAARAWVLRTRLSAWGIALLVAGILAGIAIVLSEVQRALRTARAQSDFVAGISHDLRTPISALRLMAESLQLGYVAHPDKQKVFLGAMVRETERLSQFIERVLFFVRFGQQALRMRMKPVDPGELMHETVRVFAAMRMEMEPADGGAGTPRFSGAGQDDGRRAGEEKQTEEIRIGQEMTLRLSVAHGLPRVRADATALQQVLLNLLDNAEKYGRPSPDSAPFSVDVTLAREPAARGRGAGRVVLTVADAGMGIAPAERGRIFRPFYRSARARQGHASGVGLGLALCRHIVRAHGGRITVQSTVGHGSTFRVSLPALEQG
jgi:two-component system, OmpR family, phosphate regulon sensor histidine kinase PhoR